MKKLTIAGLSALLGASVGAAAVESMQRPKTIKRADHIQKMTEFYQVLIEWLRIRQEGKSLESFFTKNGYKTVAIYGMKELGERLYDELKDSEIEVKYIIDKNADEIYAELEVVDPDDYLENVDVVVVTAIHYFDEIEETLSDKVDFPIVSLEDILYEL